jgi:hypothetical protein
MRVKNGNKMQMDANTQWKMKYQTQKAPHFHLDLPTIQDTY